MEKLPPKPRKGRGLPKEELMILDKEDLVERVIQLEAHNLQLKNIINKNLSDGAKSAKTSGNYKKRPFDFSDCHYRKVLLRILYFGWDYQGLAVQENSHQTIEHHLFHALTTTCLIEGRETSQYHRCGRTDKGVSAFGQVISINLRSCLPPDQHTQEHVQSELQYCKMLNRLLPKEIRAVAWMPIPADRPEYSARFDCKKRQYKYYFPRSDLDLAAMAEAAGHLVGSHDFRHLCKMDVGNGVTQFTRNVLAARVEAAGEGPTSMCTFVIEGNAFLWHQIRCIMAVLLLVGRRLEAPGVVAELLHVEQQARKPQYNMALDIPLNLFHCTYELEDSQSWHWARGELRTVIAGLQAEWTVHSVKTTMIKDVLDELENEYQKLPPDDETEDRVMTHTDCLTLGVKPRVYTPLLQRETCSSLEEMIEFYKKKRKIT